MAISHCYWHLLIQNGNLILLLSIQSSRMAILKCYWYPAWLRMEISHCYPYQVDHEWQFHTATDIWWSSNVNYQNGNFTLLLTSSGSIMPILHCYWHLVIKNINFTFLLTSSGQGWQLAEWKFDIATDIYCSDNGNFILLLKSTGSGWQFHIATDMLVIKNGNFTLLLTSSGQDWQFHFATDIYWFQEWQFDIATDT